jgi:hypothetical protein
MSKSIITCKLTGLTGPSVKAHIIPRAFYGLYDEAGKFREGGTVVTLQEGNYREARHFKGVYDPDMLIKEGEDLFFDCDAYAAKFFRNEFDTKAWKSDPLNPMVLTLTAKHFDAYLIRMFCMSVLWRAHTTTQHFFSNVNIGAHEPRLRRMILKKQVGDPQDFSVILYRWLGVPRPWPVMAPYELEIGGCNFVQFSTEGLVFAVKVDDKPFPAHGLATVVGGAPELAVLHRPFAVSKSKMELVERIQQRNVEKSSRAQ